VSRFSAVRLVVICAIALAASAPPAAARTTDFGAGWRFALVNPTGITDPTGAYANAQDPSFDDSAWRSVDVPHDWSIELDPTPTGGTDAGTGFLPGGLGWYRKTFTLPRSTGGKDISVEFDGVYMDSSVYVNGQLAATHAYGYTGFNVDVTRLVHTDGRTPNVIAVKVQNQLPSSRWYSGSGIYRNVHLVVQNPVHVARHGVFVTTPEISARAATVRVETSVAKSRERARPHRVHDPRRPRTGGRAAVVGRGDRRHQRAPSAPVVDRAPLPVHAPHEACRRSPRA
jgi:beta-galactosidase